MAKYSVQFVVITEVAIEADDELQAERKAFSKLKGAEKENATAVKVYLDTDLGGAIQLDSDRVRWKKIKDEFEAIDRDWVA